MPEWLTGSPAKMQIKRLGFARECSNRSGDDFLLFFWHRVPIPAHSSPPASLAIAHEREQIFEFARHCTCSFMQEVVSSSTL